MATKIAFVTFGMFIIDEIEYVNGQSPQQDLIGGAGVYAALGARLAAGIDHAKSVSWIVDMGSDFPSSIKDQIESWSTSCVFRRDNNRLTTRAWNGYGPNEIRSFKYLTPKVRLEVTSLNDEQALSSSFHMVCSSARCMELSRNLDRRRKAIDSTQPNPITVWEPIPDLCTPEELAALQQAAAGVSVVSPNGDELASFFADNDNRSQDDMVRDLMGWTDTRALSTHAVIREGAQGSTIYLAPDSFAGHQTNVGRRLAKVHLPAFHDKTDVSRVVDPTGGGNTYLGALAVGMTNSLDGSTITTAIHQSIPQLQSSSESMNMAQRVVIGALYAVIAASYAIEQCGVPALINNSLEAAHALEQWNGESFESRMAVYLDREAGYISRQLSQLDI